MTRGVFTKERLDSRIMGGHEQKMNPIDDED